MRRCLPFLSIYFLAAGMFAQQTETVDLPGLHQAEVRAVTPTGGFPSIEIRNGRGQLLLQTRFRYIRIYPDYAGGPPVTKFMELAGPTPDAKTILAASGYSMADDCHISAAVIGVRKGKVVQWTHQPDLWVYLEGGMYWGELGNGWGYGLAKWEHAGGYRFDSRVKLTLYRYDRVRNELVKLKSMTTKEVVPFQAPNPLAEFGVNYPNLLKTLLPGC